MPRSSPSRHRSLPRDSADSPRAVAVYLLQLRPLLTEAIALRRGLVRGIGRLLAAANEGHSLGVALAAGRVGGEHVGPFRQVQRGIGRLAPPPSCARCHRAVVGWLEAQIAACELLVEVRRSGALARLPETQWRLADGREQGRRFNAEYARLVADLRARVDAARRRRRHPGRPRALAAA